MLMAHTGVEVAAPDALGAAPSLPPVDEDNVFDMSDITSADSQLPNHAAAQSAQPLESGRSDDAEDDQDAGGTLDNESALGVSESPAELSGMQEAPGASLSSHADSFTWSADFMNRLSLEGGQGNANGMPGTPDSMAAMGSAPSTTLSDFSAANAPLGALGQKEGSGQRGSRQGRRSSYGTNRYPAATCLDCCILFTKGAFSLMHSECSDTQTALPLMMR